MPTGYTSKITKEMPLETFVWICARAFGALITMRDDPTDAPIPERLEPSPYYRERLEEAKAKLAAVSAWSHADAEADQSAYLQRERVRREERDRKRKDTEEGYRRMLAMVEQWEPPTPDHVELKKFMREQITGSIDFDCGDPSQYREPLDRVTPEVWKAKQVAAAAKDVAYYSESAAKEQERVDGRNQWISDLRASLQANVVRS